MIDAELFDKLEAIGRKLRKNSKPFGGIQIIATGDFFQLPPVGPTAKYAFAAESWSNVIKQTIELKHVWRQADPTFVNMLNEVRLGKLSPNTITTFNSLSRELVYDDTVIEPTRLYPLREQVDAYNSERLEKLSGDVKTYRAGDWGREIDKLTKSCIAPTELHLKIGAQVILVKNLSERLVNGSQGVVIDFQAIPDDDDSDDDNDEVVGMSLPPKRLYEKIICRKNGHPVVKFLNGDVVTITPGSWEIELPGKNNNN